MSNFALFTCLEESLETVREEIPISKEKDNLIKRVFDFIKRKFRKVAIENKESEKDDDFEVKKIEINDNTTIFMAKLPYTAEKVQNRASKINEFAYNLINENNIKTCILSEELNKKVKFEWSSNLIFNGQFLYKALIINLLEEICTNNSIKISDLDITIIHGKNDEELFPILRLLSPRAKYMTIITERKGELEGEINYIYDETGLSVSLTTDLKAALKNAYVVINLDQLSDIHNLKFNSKAVIINYNNSYSVKSMSENTLINGIELNFPVKLLQKLDKDIFKNFNKNELAETILLHKTDYDKAKDVLYKQEIFFKISNEFKRDGFKITGFRGRHNLLRIDDIVLQI